MSEAKHTPGRMLVDFRTVYILDNGTNRMTAHVQRGSVPSDGFEMESNARRLAACWNALADLPTDAIEVIAKNEHPAARLAMLTVLSEAAGQLSLSVEVNVHGVAAMRRDIKTAVAAMIASVAKADGQTVKVPSNT